eukprot:2136603-Pleurochrysis_carterae.AAC.1
MATKTQEELQRPSYKNGNVPSLPLSRTATTVRSAIACAQPFLGITVLQGIIRAVSTVTRSAFLFILLLLFQAASPMPVTPAATSTEAAYSAIPPRTIGGS